MLYENQHAHMEERLRLRAESRERQLRLRAQLASDPFECVDEVVAQYNAEQERKRRASGINKKSPVLHELELQQSESDSSDERSDDSA